MLRTEMGFYLSPLVPETWRTLHDLWIGSTSVGTPRSWSLPQGETKPEHPLSVAPRRSLRERLSLQELMTDD